MSPSDPSARTLKSLPRKSKERADVTTLAFPSSIVLTPEPAAPASVPQENLPVATLYKTVFASSLQSPSPSWNKPRDTRNEEVVAKPATCRPVPIIPPANVEVAFVSPLIVVVDVLPT